MRYRLFIVRPLDIFSEECSWDPEAYFCKAKSVSDAWNVYQGSLVNAGISIEKTPPQEDDQIIEIITAVGMTKSYAFDGQKWKLQGTYIIA